MRKLCRSDSRLVILLAAMMACAHASASLSLNLLNACGPLGKVISQLEGKYARTQACRPARTTLERAFMARLTAQGQGPCLLRDAPSPRLADFTCSQLQMSNGVQIICFQPAALNEVNVYKKTYDERHAAAEKRYLDAAAACAHSTGDAARASGSLFPMALGEIADFELGFVTSMKTSAEHIGTAVHGYAEMDPDLPGDIPTAIEFLSLSVSTSTSTAPTAQVATRKIGDWQVEIDNDAELEKGFDEIANKMATSARMFSETFSIKKQRSEATSEEKRRLLQSLKWAVARHLRGEGFTSISSKRLAALTGLSKSDLLEMVRKNKPYTLRKNHMPDQLDFVMLVNERPSACSSMAPGFMVIDVISTAATMGIRADHGEIGILVVVAGECAHSENIDRYAQKLQTQVGEAIIESLKER